MTSEHRFRSWYLVAAEPTTRVVLLPRQAWVWVLLAWRRVVWPDPTGTAHRWRAMAPSQGLDHLPRHRGSRAPVVRRVHEWPRRSRRGTEPGVV